MDEEEFYREFCTVMRRRGEVKLKNVSNIFEVPVTQARKHLNSLIKKKRIKKIGAGPSTAYVFA
jgi:Fic family protein